MNQTLPTPEHLIHTKDPSAIYTCAPCLSNPEAGQSANHMIALCPFKRSGGGGYPDDLTYSHLQKLDTRAWCHPPRLAHATLAEVQAHPPMSYSYPMSFSTPSLHIFFFLSSKHS